MSICSYVIMKNVRLLERFIPELTDLIFLTLIARRLYLGYHTRSQVLCGVAVGAGAGLIWFLLVHLVLSPIFPIIANWFSLL